MTVKAELLFAELFNSLLSLDNKLNNAQSVIIFFKFMSYKIEAIREYTIRRTVSKSKQVDNSSYILLAMHLTVL